MFASEEFTKEQDAVTSATVVYLKDTWMSALKSAVKNGLKGVGRPRRITLRNTHYIPATLPNMVNSLHTKAQAACVKCRGLSR